MTIHHSAWLRLGLCLCCCAWFVGADGALARPAADPSPAFLVKDIGPGPWDGVMRIDYAAAGLLLFIARDENLNTDDWLSDGTAAGTVRNRIGPNGSKLEGPSIIDGTMYFIADDRVHGRELWSRPAAGGPLHLVKDIVPGAVGSGASGAILVNGHIVFEANDGTHGRELWTTDGTEGGTTLLKDIEPDGKPGYYLGPYSITNNKLLFFADDGVTGFEPWVSDGTAAGTQLVKDINPGMGSSSGYRDFTGDGRRIFFDATDGDGTYGFWTSDGTAEGTVELKQGISERQFPFVTSANRTYFIVGREIWYTDGTLANTKWSGALLPDEYGVDLFTAVNDVLFFSADTPAYGPEVWTSDGTPAGTHILKDLLAGPVGSEPKIIKDINGTVVIFAGGNTYGFELYQSDGTAAGTKVIADIYPGAESSDVQSPPNIVGSNILFNADDGVHGRELWGVPLSALNKKVHSPAVPLPVPPPTATILPPATATPTPTPTPTQPATSTAPRSYFLPLMQGR